MESFPATFDEVLAALDEIIAISVKENNFLGIFAYVYRRTTAQIKKETAEGRFEDNKRMEAFDVTFANLYLKAYRQYHNGEETSQAWASSFAAKNERLTIIQHLLLGMNAHINLDLGIAAAKVMKGKPIETIKTDFMRVNDILASLTDEIQERLSRVSRLMFLIDWFGKEKDEAFANFSIRKSREFSWSFGCQLSGLKAESQTKKIKEADHYVSCISERIKHPKSRILRTILSLIKFFEEREVGRVIHNLSSDSAEYE